MVSMGFFQYIQIELLDGHVSIKMLWPDAFFESQILGEDQCGKVALILEEPFWYPVWNGKYHYIWCLHFQELRPLYCIRTFFSKAPGSLLMPKPAERTVSFGQSGGGWLRINGRSGWSAWPKKTVCSTTNLMISHGKCWGRCFDGKTPTWLHSWDPRRISFWMASCNIFTLVIWVLPACHSTPKKKKHADSEMRCKAYFLLVIQLRWKSEVFSCLCSRFRKNDV